MAERTIIETIQKYIKKLEGESIPVSFVVLFGSQARGNTHEWSDIDVMVVSPLFDRPRSREDRLQLAYIAFNVDSRIEPVACGLKQWSEDTSSMIIEIARREGKCIQAA
jgi:uncharacterized protein